ncbi:dTDP-4-dehydrorhamnose reductase [Aeromonas veronii]|uniref:dTDP-4-dehydrorhamnose reductase n=1 Tax=Aeromonas veronii TaxID=654 RepID=UPI0030048849
MNILLFGKNGQVGWELQRVLAPLGCITAVDVDSTDYCGDFSNPAGVADTVRLVRPDLIVNAAAHTAVEKAESEREFAKLLNATSVAAIAKEAEVLGAWLVHYSTDYVFDGCGERPWVETDATAPLNVYGQSKLAGEQAILASGCRHLTIRTSWLHSPWRDNFLKTMLRLAPRYDELHVVCDQVGAPTSAALLADVTIKAIARVLEEPALGGLYHVAASGAVSWYDYARFIFNEAYALGLIDKLPLLKPITSADYGGVVTRPLNSRLDTSKFQRTFDLVLPDWTIGVTRTLVEILAAGDW